MTYFRGMSPAELARERQEHPSERWKESDGQRRIKPLISFEGLDAKAKRAREAGKRLVGLPYTPRMKTNGTTDDDLRAEVIRYALREEADE